MRWRKVGRVGGFYLMFVDGVGSVGGNNARFHSRSAFGFTIAHIFHVKAFPSSGFMCLKPGLDETGREH